MSMSVDTIIDIAKAGIDLMRIGAMIQKRLEEEARSLPMDHPARRELARMNAEALSWLGDMLSSFETPESRKGSEP